MVNLLAPALLIAINTDLSSEVLSITQQQFFIDDTINNEELTARFNADPNYLSEIHGNNLRVLVVKPANDLNNLDKFDLILYFKNGLISVEGCKYGGVGISYPLRSSYLSQILNTIRNHPDYCHHKYQHKESCRCDICCPAPSIC